jgi:tRNA (cmo5U34)-methyltransferase
MSEQAERNLLILEPKSASYSLLEQDLLDTKIESAAMVLMNFTLQFVPLIKRDCLIEKIYAGLLDGGSLVLSEKIRFDDDKTNNALIDIHHQYKSDQGYSQMEISQKRDAIVNVLIPETLEAHVKRLKSAGFNVVTPWVQNLQFISILAIK